MRKRLIAVAIVIVGLVFGTSLTAQRSQRKASIASVGSGGIVLTAVPEAAVPAGTVVAYAGAKLPLGWIWCDGSKVVLNDASRRLFSSIGTTYGGDGSLNYRLPDLRGRVVVALDNMADENANVLPEPWADTLGGTGGEHEHVLSEAQLPKHKHGAQVTSNGSHSHPVGFQTMMGNGLPRGGEVTFNQREKTERHATDASGHDHTIHVDDAGASKAVGLIQPSMAMNYIIKY
jgi:microcystin-dependent protein